MKSIFAIVILAVSLAAVAQSRRPPVDNEGVRADSVNSLAVPEKPAPLVAAKPEVIRFKSESELTLRKLQVKKMKAYSTLVSANEAFQQATKEMDAGVQKVYAEYGLDAQRDPLCDGPSSDQCLDVKDGDLVVKKMPVQQAKK